MKKIFHRANFVPAAQIHRLWKGMVIFMKKNPKQLVAIIALIAIAVLLIAFVISAFTAGSGDAGNRFMALLFCIIAIPILAWVTLFCIGRMQNKHTVADFLPDQDTEENK